MQKKRKNRRTGRGGLCLLLVLMLVILAGCQQEENTADQTKSIVIWAWDDTFNVKAARMAAVQYGKDHPDVDIKVVTKEREEILSDTKNLLASKVYESLPDVILIEDYDIQDVLSLYENEFVELTDRIDVDKFADYKSSICSKDGKFYGIPFDSGVTALFYRIDILEKAGFTEKDMQNLTWDEFIEIGKTVYQKEHMSMITLDPTDLPQIRLMMQSCGSWYVKEDGITADIENNESLRQSLVVYEQLLQQNVGVSVNGWNDFIAAFQEGNVASVINGGWIISNIKEVKEQSGLWRVAPIPVVSANPNGGVSSNVGGSSWYILKHGQNSEAAVDFMSTMFSENDEFMDSLISEIGIIPAVKDPTVYKNYEAGDDYFGGQQVTKLLTQLEKDIPAINYGSKTYEIENILEEEIQNMLAEENMDKCLQKVQMKAKAVAKE